MYFAAVSPYFARKEGTNIKGIFYDLVDNIMKNTFFFQANHQMYRSSRNTTDSLGRWLIRAFPIFQRR